MEHFVIREERHRIIRSREQVHEYYVVPREDPMIMFEQLGKRADHHQQDFADHFHKPYYYPQQNHHAGHKGPYLHATVVHQQPCVAHRGPLVQTRIAPRLPHQQGTVIQYHHEREDYQQPNMASSQAPQAMERPGGVMDAKEVAKLYGGMVFTDYGRNNKFPVRAN